MILLPLAVPILIILFMLAMERIEAAVVPDPPSRSTSGAEDAPSAPRATQTADLARIG
jgi:hypothetical protein